MVRAMLIDHLVKTEYGSLFPYLMNVSVFRLGAVSLQEIIGWSVAATIAWLTADRFLRMLKLEVAPDRTALVAIFVMSAICLAVETAAMESGWCTFLATGNFGFGDSRS